MHFSALLAAGASLLSLTSARIDGFSVPSTVAPDSTFKLQISASNYIQSVQDVAFSFGISQKAYPSSLGQLLDSKFLGPDNSNVVGNITHYIHIPATFPKGQATITGALFSLYGAVLSPSAQVFAVNVTVGSSTSSDYVFSKAS